MSGRSRLARRVVDMGVIVSITLVGVRHLRVSFDFCYARSVVFNCGSCDFGNDEKTRGGGPGQLNEP